MAASATLALKAGVWFRRGRLLIVSPDSLGTACPLSGRNSTYRPVQISAAGSFITHVIFARDVLIKKHPELVRAFLTGWFDTIAYMKKHKKITVAITAKAIGISPSIGSRVYDQELGGFSTNGVFDRKGLATLRKSF